MPSFDRPADDHTLIGHISDLHFGSAHADDVWRSVSKFLVDTVRPNLLLITGDLVDTPKARLYEHAKTALDNLRIPYYVCAGNHDRHLKGNVSRRLSLLKML